MRSQLLKEAESAESRSSRSHFGQANWLNDQPRTKIKTYDQMIHQNQYQFHYLRHKQKYIPEQLLHFEEGDEIGEDDNDEVQKFLHT